MGICESPRRAVVVCGTVSPAQDNWLITQFINTTSNVRQQEVFIRITYAIPTITQCTSDCEVNIYVFQTNETNQSYIRNISVFLDQSLSSLRDDSRGSRISSVVRFEPNSLYGGFYLAFRDLGACISISEVVVYYPICDAIFLEFGLNFTKAQIPEGASLGSCFANMAMDLNATDDHVQAVCILRLDRDYLPTWTVISENATGCMCIPGYRFISRTTIDQCEGKVHT